MVRSRFESGIAAEQIHRASRRTFLDCGADGRETEGFQAMTTRYLFDSFALLAFFQKEQGAEIKGSLLSLASAPVAEPPVTRDPYPDWAKARKPLTAPASGFLLCLIF
jgi:hypothetical protein